ncbi:MAG: formylglycine-generating enzyme family protein, partial [Phycisphaerae bacterium]|nr:formylglycine-generating enzyme family protein [Phycisphaerae bacterium]
GAQTNPSGPATGSYRVFRGGSWSSHSDVCRASVRFSTYPGSTGIDVGFRAARTP